MTWTRGLRLALLATAASLCVPAGAAPAATPLLSLYFVPDITVVLNGVTVSPQEVAINDLMGNITRDIELKTIASGRVSAGEHIVSIDASELASGTYVVTLSSGHISLARQMVVTK